MQMISTAWAWYVQHLQKSCLGSGYPFMVNSVYPDSVGLTENGPNVISAFKTFHVEIWEPNDGLSDVNSEGALWIFKFIEIHKEHPLQLTVRRLYCQPKGIERMVSPVKMKVMYLTRRYERPYIIILILKAEQSLLFFSKINNHYQKISMSEGKKAHYFSLPLFFFIFRVKNACVTPVWHVLDC